ncbi:MAG TPA: Kdo hydroxylase family protein [Casimicrobiaceae bacterium]|nr:Kdo hydroxylase family protein [Casimicrobiaceae bacterium]
MESRNTSPAPIIDSSLTPLISLDVATWHPRIAPTQTERYARELESGAVLVLPRLPFDLLPDEQRFLHTRWSNGKAKNISLEGSVVTGARGSVADLAALATMIARFAENASALVAALFPRYSSHLTRARTSYRPHGAAARAVSWRKDDTRLHVDAFPSRPNRGERILRVFCNVNPHGEDRVWRVGEAFEPMARRLIPRVRAMLPGEAGVLAAIGVTKSRRSEYDHLMLGLHDRAKADLDYQTHCAQREVRFAPGTTWICYSDQVMHAASSGQYMFEQTTHLPISALYEPARSPLAVLERITGRKLVARPSPQPSPRRREGA